MDIADSLIRAKDYKNAGRHIYTLLNTHKNDTRLLLNLFLCYCGNRQFADARSFYGYIKNIKKTPAQEIWLTTVVSKYNTSLNPVTQNNNLSALTISMAGTIIPTAGVWDKIGLIYNCFDTGVIIKISQAKPVEELEKRRFNINQKLLAVQKLYEITGKQYKVDSIGSFMAVTKITDGYSKSSVHAIVDSLNRVYSFFKQAYQCADTSALITLYLCRDGYEISEIANLIHGINVPATNLGYSCKYDNSLIGIANSGKTGSLNHELFHLAVSSAIPDLPAWLDEGLACLYSTYAWKDNVLTGSYTTWRTHVLHKANSSIRGTPQPDFSLKLPNLSLLINYSWGDFNSLMRGNMCRVAVNYAMANHLLLYLQQKSLLTKMFNAFKTRPVNFSDTSFITATNTEIFEAVTGEPLAKTEQKFSSWLARTYNFDTLYLTNHLVPDFEDEYDICSTLIDAIHLAHAASPGQNIAFSRERAQLNDILQNLSDTDKQTAMLIWQQKEHPELALTNDTTSEAYIRLIALYDKMKLFETKLRRVISTRR